MRRLILSLVILLASLPVLAQGVPDDFDDEVVEGMELWHAPGLAIAMVKGDQVIHAAGYGSLSAQGGGKINPDTLFRAASTTKAFVSMAVGMLVDDGLVGWDDPIIKHLPDFETADPCITRGLTIRDALSHRSGLSQVSNLNLFLSDDLEETFQMLPRIGAQSGIRASYDYNNTTYALAGAVIEKVTGKPWGTFVRERLLEPLGMTRTYTTDAPVMAEANRAEQHYWVDGEHRQIPYGAAEYAAAAGAMTSSVSDMTQWLKFLLADGRWYGEQMISARNWQEMQTPQILLRPNQIYPGVSLLNSNYAGYGLGWFLFDFRGRKVVMHTGSLNGTSAILGLLPEEDIGVVIYINGDHVEYRHALMYRAFDIMLGEERTDWSTALHALYFPPDADAAPRTPVPAVKDPLTLVGRWQSKGTFPLDIGVRNGTLRYRIGREAGRLDPQEDGTVMVYSDNVPFAGYPLTTEPSTGNGVAKIMFWGMAFSPEP